MKILTNEEYQDLINQRNSEMDITNHWFSEYTKLLKKHKALLLKLKHISEEENK